MKRRERRKGRKIELEKKERGGMEETKREG